MLNNSKRPNFWKVIDVTSAEELAQHLVKPDWAWCEAFRYGDYLITTMPREIAFGREYHFLRRLPSGDWEDIENVSFDGLVDELDISRVSYQNALEMVRDVCTEDYHERVELEMAEFSVETDRSFRKGSYNRHVYRKEMIDPKLQHPEEHGLCPRCPPARESE